MSEKIVFPKDVEVGKYYLVPHVKVNDFWFIENEYIPVNSPLHEDADIINFKTPHWHVDWRFIPNKIYKKIIDEDTVETNIQVKSIITEMNNKELCGNKALSNDIVYLRRKCVRNYEANVFHIYQQRLYNTWPVKLQSAFCGQHLRQNENGQYVCPHKGAIVDLKYLDEKGNAVCPVHLLKFDTKTLKAI